MTKQILYLLSYIILFHYISPTTIQAQSHEENLAKYWNYRDRFLGTDGNGGFIDLGLEQGQSIPASGRNWEDNCATNWHSNNKGCEVTKGNGSMRWGDGTYYLGHYISFLALEYNNLKFARQDTRATEYELWLALKAFHRLDSLAETYFGMEPQIDGFFLRDDVPPFFFLEEGAPDGRRFSNGKNQSISCVLSDGSCGGVKEGGGGFVSQDQVLAMFMGFLFVTELAPGAQYLGENLAELAALGAHNIAQHLQEKKWKLYFPDGEQISNRWGGDVRGFSYVIASAAARINKQNQSTYQTGWSKTFGAWIYSSFSWAYNAYGERNSGMMLKSAILLNGWQPNKIAKRALKTDQIIYAFADAVVNNKPLGKKANREELEEILNAAPIDGPCFGTENCEAPDGWKSYDRWWHAYHKNGNPYGIHLEFSGIDYMFAYNLYHYLYREELPAYKKH